MSYIHCNKSGKILMFALLAISMSVTGCQTIKKSGGSVSKNAQSSEGQYYQQAKVHIDKKRYIPAANQLKELRLYYPIGQFADKALLDLIYIEYQRGNFKESINYAKEFVRLYPNHAQSDYAYYVIGVANMVQANGTSLFNTDQSERDTAYYRLAFSAFVQLIKKHPNSSYVPDGAQRMTFIYNQFAKHELNIALYYTKRKAYVAAINRAKWVFQYYPRSESVPKAIATLAYAYGELGVENSANEYKELLKINYPQWLTPSGKVVNLHRDEKKSLIKKLQVNPLKRSGQALPVSTNQQAQAKIIKKASQLQLAQ